MYKGDRNGGVTGFRRQKSHKMAGNGHSVNPACKKGSIV